MALTDDLASVLETLGYGTWGGGILESGTTIFDGHEPPDPPVCTTVYAPGGPPDTLDLSGNSYGERPAQIRMRDPDYAALKTRIEALYKLWTPWSTYQTYHLRLKAASKPFYGYPQDERNNFIASFGITCIQGG